MKYIFGFLFLILVALFEASVMPSFSFFGTQPSLLLTGLLVLQFLGFAKEAYYGGFFGGILLDLFAGTHFGFSSLVFVLISGTADLAQRFAEESLLVLFLTTFGASIVFRIVHVFPALDPLILVKGGILDVGVVAVVYPIWKYFLKNVFGCKELLVRA